MLQQELAELQQQQAKVETKLRKAGAAQAALAKEVRCQLACRRAPIPGLLAHALLWIGGTAWS